MDNDKTIKSAINDYIIDDINESGFIDRLRLISTPTDIVLKCIKSWDDMIQCMNEVEVEKNTSKGLSPLEEMVLLAEKNGGEDIDQERDHKLADELLLRRLVELNETRIVAEFIRIKKWYS